MTTRLTTFYKISIPHYALSVLSTSTLFLIMLYQVLRNFLRYNLASTRLRSTSSDHAILARIRFPILLNRLADLDGRQ